MSAVHDVQALLGRLASAGKLRLAHVEPSAGEPPPPKALALSWPELDAILPDGGLPAGVVELAAPRALGGATSVALAAVRAGQARGAKAWCAWVDPEATLHAPGVVAAGVDLARMLVVRAPRAELVKAGVKVVASGAFEVVVIDVDAVPQAEGAPAVHRSADRSRRPPGGRPAAFAASVWVRKLALAAEPTGATVLLLTDASRPREAPWPVALRVELSRPALGDLAVRVAKERRGRIGLAKTIPFRSVDRPALRGAGLG